jgi:hypothetical protein
VPLSIFGPVSDRIQVPGREGEGVISLTSFAVAPGYFRAMRIPLLEGRDFTERDDLRVERVIIVNHAFARRYFDGRSPVGRKVRVSGDWCTVIGMAADSKYRTPAEGPTPVVYGPFGQMFWSGYNNFFFMRTADPDRAAEAFRREAAALDPNKGLYDLSVLTNYTQAGLFGERVAASLLSALAALALALAAVGLYSVMAYSVSERTREIGVRVALGAEPRQVLALVLRKGLALTAAGLAAGAAAAIAGARVLSSSLDSPVGAGEPAVFAAAALLLISIALLASYIPARRATKVDPLAALRSE